MARGVLILIGVLNTVFVTYKSFASARSMSSLSCTSYHSGDYVILDCYYSGGVPFPTLSWTGPGGLHKVKGNSQRLAVNMSRDIFVNRWDTIYKCKATYRYTSSSCYVGHGIGSYVAIAFGVLALLILLCIFIVIVYKACHTLSDRFKTWQGEDVNSDSNVPTGYKNPTYKHDAEQDGKKPE